MFFEVFVWHIRLKVMMRVLEEIQGLLSQSRKAFQMNCLARYLSVSLSKAVLKVGEDFGECFKYNPMYFGKINRKLVKIEAFIYRFQEVY